MMAAPAGMPEISLAMVMSMAPRQLMVPPPADVVAGARSYLNVPFAMIPGFRLLRLDLHVPVTPRPGSPVVMYASGGAWLMSLKAIGPWQFLLREGYAVASVEYRVSGEARHPAGVHDLKAAARWLRANAGEYGLDATSIVAWGSSAGGYLSSMCGVTNGRPEFEGAVGDHPDQPSDVMAVIDHYGAIDLAKMAEDTNSVPGVLEHFGTETSPETKLLGYRPQDDLEQAELANPAHYLSPGTVPFLIMHGDADTRLGIRQSERFYDQLRQAGVKAQFHVLPGANHGTPEFDSPEAHQLALDFLASLDFPGRSAGTAPA
jgi:acetyl esterase/lipase